MIFIDEGVINEKPLTSFFKVDNFEELVKEEKDCIWDLGEFGGGEGNYLNDFNGQNLYALAINNAFFIPADFLNDRVSVALRSRYEQECVRFSTHANSIITEQSEFFSDSFTRHRLVNYFFEFLGAGQWRCREKIPADYVDENIVFLDLLCNHFGHALVDTPARFWFVRRFIYELLDLDFKFAFFPTHGLKGELDKIPKWLEEFCIFIGIPLDKTLVIDRPTSFKKAIIPKRVSPYLGGRGDFSIFKDSFSGGDFPGNSSAKIFLSRSGLRTDARRLNKEDELKLENFFIQQGFSIVHSQDFNFNTQVQLIRNASHIAGLAGSQLHLALFCSDDKCKMFKIAPSAFNLPIDRRIMRLVGGEYSQFVVEGQGDGHRKAWNIPEKDFCELKAKVLQWLEV